MARFVWSAPLGVWRRLQVKINTYKYITESGEPGVCMPEVGGAALPEHAAAVLDDGGKGVAGGVGWRWV